MDRSSKFLKKLKHLFTFSGFSLLESMVSLALLSIAIVILLMTTSVNQNNSYKKFQKKVIKRNEIYVNSQQTLSF
jgi:prepilin-type N-terminal cleavage/methylation domain-containing protein